MKEDQEKKPIKRTPRKSKERNREFFEETRANALRVMLNKLAFTLSINICCLFIYSRTGMIISIFPVILFLCDNVICHSLLKEDMRLIQIFIFRDINGEQKKLNRLHAISLMLTFFGSLSFIFLIGWISFYA